MRQEPKSTRMAQMYKWLSNQERVDAKSRSVYIPLLALGSLTTLAGWRISVQVNIVDYIFLPTMSVSLMVLAVLLARDKVSLNLVKFLLLLSISSYQIASLSYITFSGLMFLQGLSATAMWTPIVFPLAFVLLPHRLAFLFSWAFYLIMVAIGLMGLLAGLRPNASAINSIVQFYIASLAFLSMQLVYSNYRRQYIDMHDMAHTDPLTGMANRRLMQELLEKQCALAGRNNESFSVLMMDLDHFKWFNDEYGHAMGDQILREVAVLLNGMLRQYDTLARWGGEEFVIMAPKADSTQASHLAHRIAEVLAGTRIAGMFQVSASIGLTGFRPGDTADTVIRRADEAMYRAKAAGRNRLEQV